MNLIAEHALLPQGWAREVGLTISPDGALAAVTPNARGEAGAERLEGFVIPGLANLHSHAFQRAMAGLTEARTHPTDSFWTWRSLMYGFAGRITPGQMHAIAAWAYIEMLKAGFTAVGEFHYVHHDEAGKPYADPAEMSHRVIAAAREAGIAITHLPVLYMNGGFGGKPPEPGQQRFVHDCESFARLIESLHTQYRSMRDVRLGCAFHSLRAVEPYSLRATLDAQRRLDDGAPIHIHIAEQVREVADCLAWSRRRPVDWLLDHAPVDSHWCLVHATHMESRESRRLAACGAVAGLCPTTEANLGDGIFPASEYLAAAGHFGIGSDSHVNVSAIEELRLLEYGQRLTAQRRAALATDLRPSPGERLFVDAAAGGAQALGIAAGRIEAGARADLVVLDPAHPAFWNKQPGQVLDAWVFAGDARCVRDVMAGGAWRVRGGRHAHEAEAAQRFRHAQAALLE
jgi:formimidoylglutamate deiminase